KRIGVGVLAVIIFATCLELGERFEIPGVRSVVSTAEAIVGRPPTPVSYAGVARGTARRRAAGGYYCYAGRPPYGAERDDAAWCPPVRAGILEVPLEH